MNQNSMNTSICRPYWKISFFFGCIGSQLWHVGSFVAARGLFIVLHGLFVLARGLLSSCGVQVFSLQLWHTNSRARGLCSCGAWAPERLGSAAVVRGLSCPAACGILVPRPGMEPVSPALEGGFFTTGPPGKSCKFYFKFLSNCFFKPETYNIHL